MKIGIDFGGVIVMPADGESPFVPELGLDIAMPGAISTIQYLIHDLHAEVWVISKASKATQVATRHWLNQVAFYQQTGFAAANLHFCAKRSDKLAICQSLGITHFIDDTLEVLQHLQGTVPNLYLLGANSALDGIITVASWLEIRRELG